MKVISHTNLLFTLVPHTRNLRNCNIKNKILAYEPDSFELQNNGGNKGEKIRTFFTKFIDPATGTERLIPHNTSFIRDRDFAGKFPSFYQEFCEKNGIKGNNRVIEDLAASTCQRSLETAIALYDALGEEAEGIRIVCSDKFAPQDMKTGYNGDIPLILPNWEIISAEELNSRWNEAKEISNNLKQPLTGKLSDYVDLNPVETGYIFLPSEDSQECPSKEYSVKVNAKTLPVIQKMLQLEAKSFENNEGYDLIDVINSDPFVENKTQSRLILLQNVVHTLTDNERGKLISALKTLPRSSVVRFGITEQVGVDPTSTKLKYTKEEAAEFLSKLPEIGFEPVDENEMKFAWKKVR